ncbi:MAG: helicase-related protein [Desulfobacteraceae bacterium]
MSAPDIFTPGFQPYPWRLSYRTSTLKPDGKPLNILQDFYLPVLHRAVRYYRVAGYFRSTSLAAASQGFSAFANHEGQVRLIVGADLAPEDVQTILTAHEKREEGLASPKDPLEMALNRELAGFASWPEAVRNGVQLLAWLIARGNLEIKVAFRIHVRTGEPLPFESVADGYVHMKWGLFSDLHGNRIYISGSLNESKTALTLNAENIDVHCDWRGDTERQRVEEAEREFTTLWEDQSPGVRVLTLPEAVQQQLIKIAETITRPTEIDGTSAAPLAVPPPSAFELLRFALIKDGPRLPGGRWVGMETTPITPWPHQEVVARRVIATYPFSYLLCDEVGLGKTIEAGLIIRSLYLSGLIKRVLIAAPASLTEQWQREMASKFFLPFGRALGGTLPQHEFILPSEEQKTAETLYDPDLTIISTGLLVRPERQADLQDAKNFDLTLIDEAHNIRRKNPTEGFKAEPKFGRLFKITSEYLRPQSKCLLLATATPMQLDPVEVYDLLWLTNRVGAFQYDPSLSQWYNDILGRLVREEAVADTEYSFLRKAILSLKHEDPFYSRYLEQTVIDGRIRTSVRRWLEQGEPPPKRDLKGILRLIFYASPLHRVMLRHTRALLEIYQKNNQLNANLARRRILPLCSLTFTAQEQHCYDQLEVYCKELAVQIGASGDKNQITAMGFYLNFLRLRFASSLYALKQTLKRRLGRVQDTLTFGLKELGPQTDKPDWEDLIEAADDDRPMIQSLLQNREPEDLEWERDYLIGMLSTLDDLSGPSSKLQELLRSLETRRIRGTSRLQQAVIFTRFFDTLTDISTRLRQIDHRMLIGTFSGQQCQYVDPKTWRLVGTNREEIRRRFLRREIDLLICTDAAAEGLNLQSADLVINFDLPWNPMRVEQRIGRIDRIGQQHEEVNVLNFCYAGSAEEIVYGRLLSRLTTIGALVGTQQISLLPVIPKEFQELAEKKLSETRLEKIALERAKLARQRLASREIPADYQYNIYRRLKGSTEFQKPPVSLENIWDVLSNSNYLRDLGCQIWPESDKQVIILRNISGVPDDTALTTSRQTFEYGLDNLEGNLHFATYGSPVFEALLKQVLNCKLPKCIKIFKIDGKPSDSYTVGYAVGCFDGNGVADIRLVTSFEDLENLHLNEDTELHKDDIQSVRQKLADLAAQEYQQASIAAAIESRNTTAAHSQVALNYMIIQYLLQFRQQFEKADGHFWPEVKAIEESYEDRNFIRIPNIPKIQAEKLAGLIFDLQIPAVGDKVVLDTPIPLIKSALDSVCRLANKMHKKKSELLVDEVLFRIDREIRKELESLT